MAVLAPSRVVVIALLPACAFEARIGEGYRCGPDDPCPIDAAAGDMDGGGDVPDAGTFSVRFDDDFDDGELTGWNPWSYPGCTVDETGGALRLDFTGEADAYCGANLSTSFDLRTGAAIFEVAEVSAFETFEAYVILFSDDRQDQIHMVREADGLTMRLELDEAATASRTIADPGDRFWRIRKSGGTTIWETSTDGAGWQEQHRTTTAVDASAMFVELAAGHYAPTGGAARARFDRVTIE